MNCKIARVDFETVPINLDSYVSIKRLAIVGFTQDTNESKASSTERSEPWMANSSFMHAKGDVRRM